MKMLASLLTDKRICAHLWLLQIQQLASDAVRPELQTDRQVQAQTRPEPETINPNPKSDLKPQPGSKKLEK